MLHPDVIETTIRQFPPWVPSAACRYLEHTILGTSIRSLARRGGCHASTVLRQIRKFENLRDDILVDDVLRHLGKRIFCGDIKPQPKRRPLSMQSIKIESESQEMEFLNQESTRILRRLCETGAVLAVAAEMEKAVVVRDSPAGESTKIAVVAREIAQAMALKEWIHCTSPARISRYHITAAGRMALNKLLAEAENRAVSGATGFAENQAAFLGAKDVSGDNAAPGSVGQNATKKKIRYNMGESPLTLLARRKDKNGAAFLSNTLVNAGERLREDFELAHLGPRVSQNWDRFLTGNISSGNDDRAGEGASAARVRIENALKELGPGLADVALRCCCYLEGLETAEKQLGWSARSGKIVLRIALQRLSRHYEVLGQAGVMIG